MRVVFLIRSLNRGGAERQLAELAKGLAGRSIEVSILTFYAGGPIWDELVKFPTVQVTSLGKRGRWDVVGFALRLRQELRRLKPDVLHCYMVEPSVFGLIIGRMTKVPAIVWGVRASNMDYSKYQRVNWLSFKVAAVLSRYADLIIANSEAGRKYHTKMGYSPQHFVAIPNGIDAELFRPCVTARIETRTQWCLTRGEFVVGVAARLDPMKGHLTLLRAAKNACGRVAHLRFVCVGSGPESYSAELHAHANQLGLADRVLWPGECDDMRSIYPAFDTVCSSSSFGEGFSNAIGEAMACSVPCIVTDVGDSATVVGNTGFVAPPNDPLALADAIVKMSTLSVEVRAALGADARRRVVERYGLAAMIAKTEESYRELAANELRDER
jgi:glycosyltransferase involved in cell wall biosynthesis